MSDYYSKFLGLFAKTRQNQSARLLGIESVFPDQEQIGEGVTTRSQAQIHPEPESSRSQAQTSPEPESNANQHFDENDVEEEIEIETEKNPNESDVEKEKNKNERTKKFDRIRPFCMMLKHLLPKTIRFKLLLSKVILKGKFDLSK